MSKSTKRDREAHLTYQRNYVRTPEQRARDVARHTVHTCANRRLREAHAGEYARLYREEMIAAGLEE